MKLPIIEQMQAFVDDHVVGCDLIGFAIAVQSSNGASMWEQETDDPAEMVDVLGSVLDDVNRLRLANLKHEAEALGFDLVEQEPS